MKNQNRNEALAKAKQATQEPLELNEPTQPELKLTDKESKPPTQQTSPSLEDWARAIEAHRQELYEAADQVAQDYWKELNKLSKERGNWSSLTCRIRGRNGFSSQATPQEQSSNTMEGSVTIEWVYMKFVSGNHTYKHVPKQRGDKYHLSTLKKYSKGEELNLVIKAEEEFRKIRASLEVLKKAKVLHKNLNKQWSGLGE